MSTDIVKKRILDRVPLAQLVGESVKLMARSGFSIGLCPFHADKDPSFRVYPDHYYCYGCKKHGDAISWMREREGLGFIEALRHLSAKYGIEAPELDDPAQKQRQDRAARLYKVTNAAQSFFTAQLRSPAGAKALEYLRSRGFTDESIADFGMGYAPDSWDACLEALRREGISAQDARESSLALLSDRSQRFFDFFRERAMIPIHDVQGRVIAFAGRTLNNDTRKYMNSGDTPLFEKKSTVFGLHRAKSAMRESKYAVIVEGQMDVLMLWQYGFRMTVASMGTALSEHHLRSIANHTPKAILLFDGDAAGQKATLEMASIACRVPKLEMRVALLPPPNDPDEFVRDNGPDALRALLDNSVELTDYAINLELRGASGLAIPQLVQRSFAPWLAGIADPIHRSYLTSRVHQRTGVSVAEIDRLVRVARDTAAVPSPDSPATHSTPTARPNAPISAATRSVERREITPLQRELLGHLFFARPTDQIDLPEIKTFITTTLEMGEPWLSLATEFLERLASDGCPVERPIGEWLSLPNPGVEPLLNGFTKDARAFETERRAAQISKIIVECEIRQNQQAIRALKANLYTLQDDEERRRVFQSITDLSRKQMELEKRLR